MLIVNRADLKVYSYLKRARDVLEEARKEKILSYYSHETDSIHIMGIAKMLQKEELHSKRKI